MGMQNCMMLNFISQHALIFIGIAIGLNIIYMALLAYLPHLPKNVHAWAACIVTYLDNSRQITQPKSQDCLVNILSFQNLLNGK